MSPLIAVQLESDFFLDCPTRPHGSIKGTSRPRGVFALSPDVAYT